jgi:hypothetical protein
VTTTNFINHIRDDDDNDDDDDDDDNNNIIIITIIIIIIIIIKKLRTPNHKFLLCSRLYTLIAIFHDTPRADTWFKYRTATTAGDNPK